MIGVAAVAGLVAMTGRATIHFEQDFDTMTLGDINGQQGWYGVTPLSIVQSTVAVEGNALETGNGAFGTGYYNQPFAIGRANQWLSFDIRLGADIYDFAGTPSVDMQAAFAVRGPEANQKMTLVYKAVTNSAGQVAYSRWEMRGTSPWLLSPDARKDTWYSVLIKCDFAAGTADAEVWRAGQAWWDPEPIAGFDNDGNVNDLYVSTDSTPSFSVFVDNILIIPEPATGLTLAVCGLFALRRRPSR